MTVIENLREMLALAIALKRPAAEVESIRRQLDAYGPVDVVKVQAAQSNFLRSIK